MPDSRRFTRSSSARRPARGERGQSLVLIAAGMIGLLAFVGLTVDVGTLYIGMGHLRRAVDAAALAAASQFREGRSYDELNAAARQVISLNGVEPTTMQLSVCVDSAITEVTPDEPFHDPAMCPGAGGLHRKLIRVTATSRVTFSFLALIGWFDTEIRAQATSEAASVDVVLTLDTSSSMTQDAQCGDGDNDDFPDDSLADDGCPGGPALAGAHRDDAFSDPAICNTIDAAGADGLPGECHPFEEVKSAALNFVERLYYPYDRVAVVTFDIVPSLLVPITNTNTVTQTTDSIRNLSVSERRIPGVTPDCDYNTTGDPSGCTNTSIGGGLRVAGGEFGRHPVRIESIWVVILLTDGAANATDFIDGSINRYCPPSTWLQPFCRDADVDTRHSRLPGTKINSNNVFDLTNYDADDYARDMADFVACAPTEGDLPPTAWCEDSLDYSANQGGQGALVYAIGLGRLVVDFTAGGDPDAGDATLRYIAAVGDDGDASTDPCVATPVPVPLTAGNDSYNCGNYFFSEFGTGLTAVFESIASRLFTRLTQ